MLSACLDVAFNAAVLIDSPQLQGSICLGWLLMPEVQNVVTTYAERFLEQVETQVHLGVKGYDIQKPGLIIGNWK